MLAYVCMCLCVQGQGCRSESQCRGDVKTKERVCVRERGNGSLLKERIEVKYKDDLYEDETKDYK